MSNQHLPRAGNLVVSRLLAVTFAAAYGAVRLYWAAGGRRGLSVCDQPARPDPGRSVHRVRGRPARGVVVLAGLGVSCPDRADGRGGGRRQPAARTRAGTRVAAAAVSLVVVSFPGSTNLSGVVWVMRLICAVG